MKRISMILAACTVALASCANGGEKAAEPQEGGFVMPVAKSDMTTVVYVQRDTLQIQMDIYENRSLEVSGPRPVYIYSFGGGWAMGSRKDPLAYPWYDHLCEKGFVCVSIDYRLGLSMRESSDSQRPGFSMNDRFQNAIDMGVEDLFAATAYLVEHAEELNIDPAKIIISGSSAGAIDSMNAMYYICSGHELARKTLPEGFQYAGVIPMAGAVYIAGADTPLHWDSTPAPVLFFHGTDDPTVTFSEEHTWRSGYGPASITRTFDRLGVSYMSVECVGGDHVMALVPLKLYWNEMDSFIDRIVLGGEHLQIHYVENSDKPKTNDNFLSAMRSMPPRRGTE